MMKQLMNHLHLYFGLYSCIFIFLFAFICYSNTLSSEFVYDDTRAILANQDLLPSKPWHNLLFNDFWGTPLSHSGSHKSYRPVCVFSFRLNYLFGQLNPWGYHLVNVILHGIVSCLFTYFCLLFYNKKWVVLLGGLMFAAHPIHTEAVAGIVGRADVGAALFFLLSLICYIKASNGYFSKNILWFCLSLLFSLLAMFTKEQGITVLGLCIVLEILIVSKCNIAQPSKVFENLRTSGGHIRCLFLTIWSVAVLYLRFLIMQNTLPEFSNSDNPAANDPNILTRFFTFMYLPFCNLYLLFFPWQLSYDWSIEAIPLVEKLVCWENVCSILMYSSLIYILWFYLRCFHLLLKNKNNQNVNIFDLMIFGLAVMIIPFLPASNLFFYVGFIVAERVLYIPSIGFCFLFVNGLYLMVHVKKQPRWLYATVVLSLIFALQTYQRNIAWKDEENLYRSGLVLSPAKSYLNLGNVLNARNKTKEAEQAYRTALKFRSNMADTHYNLGILLQNERRYKEAIYSYKEAIKYRPRLATAHLNLGVTLMSLNLNHDALKVFQNASNLSDHGLKDPGNHAISLTHIRYNAGRILFNLRNTQDAIKWFNEALAGMPDNYEPQSIFNMLGQAYSDLKKYKEAEYYFLKALEFKGDHVPALLTYAQHLVSVVKDYTKAEQYFKKAIFLDPDRVESYQIYGRALVSQSKFDEALLALKKALQILPRDEDSLSIISSIYREMKDYENALYYQLQLNDIKSNDAIALLNLGALYHLMGRLKDAKKSYADALKLDPTNPILLENIKKLEKITRV
ncbi:protein O-mannosyl-transferase tmtc2 isoform X1 [Hydra vulgaris]|uniref:protein O-mannosyl-transferase tmtc2 isoform X1 n=1 Tax=Hydra vulgaris TaxID=6087 RepID=UPI001F5E6F73|nr:protein O-mannosyl-transferase TMTC2 [Hydra vulgaris]